MEQDDHRREVPLHRAIESMQSDSSASRKEGLKETKRILDEYRQVGGFTESKRVGIQDLFDAVFRATVAERNSYNKTSAKNSARAVLSSVELCGSVFRIATEVTHTFIRGKTVRAIIGHVIQILVTPEGGFFSPLVSDYVRGLSILLKFRPHVEHLSPDDWSDAVDFCIRGLQFYSSMPNRQKASKRSFAASQVTDGESESSSVSRSWSNSVANANIVRAEFMNCIFFLVSAPSKPVPQKARNIVGVALDTVRDIPHSSNIALPSLATINVVFSRISSSDLAIAWEILETFLSVAHNVAQIAEYLIWDEMLAILIQFQPFLRKAIGMDIGRRISSHIEELLNKLRKEYLKPPKQSSHRGHLHISNLHLDQLNPRSFGVTPFYIPGIQIRRSSPWAESAWTTLHFVAFLSIWIDDHNKACERETYRGYDGSAPKRLKMSTRIEELANFTVNGSSVEERACSLQILLFALNQLTFSAEELRSLLGQLYCCASAQETEISAWSFLCIACASFQVASEHKDLTELWLASWQIGLQQLYSVALNRVVCHTLCAILFNERIDVGDFEEELRSILPYGTGSGLPFSSDATLSLSCIIMDKLRTRNPGLVDKGDRIRWLSWLFTKWAPSKLEDRSHVHHLSASFPFGAVMSILDASASLKPIVDRKVFEVPDVSFLGRQWQSYHNSASELQYILLLDQTSHSTQSSQAEKAGIVWKNTLNLFEDIEDPSLFRFLLQEVDRTRRYLCENLELRPTFMTKDLAQVVSNFSLASEIIASRSVSSHMPLIHELRSSIETLSSLLHTVQTTAADRKEVVEVFLETAQYIQLPPAWYRLNVDHQSHGTIPLFNISAILKSYDKIRESQDFASQDTSFFSEDFDLGFDSQLISAKPKSDSGLSIWDPAEQWLFSPYHTSIAFYLQLLSATPTSLDGKEQQTGLNLLSCYTERIDGCSSAEFLATYPLLQFIFSEKFNFFQDPQSLSGLLEHISDNLLGNYELERSDLPTLMCLDILGATTALWTKGVNKDLSDVSTDLYEWLTKVLVKKSLLSRRVKMRSSSMLYALIQTDGQYSPDSDSQTPQQTILSLLQNAEIPVQFSIIRNLTLLFGRSKPNNSETLFGHIHESLPKNLDYSEGISLRLLALSKLAVFDKSLLRKCAYYILETAAASRDAVPHAAWCLHSVASQLGLTSAKELFKLFQSQVIYNWTVTVQTDSNWRLDSIPFEIFGYGSLKDLLMDAKDEMTAQLAGTRDSKIKKDFESKIGSTCGNVIVNGAFSRSMAYAYLQDASETKASPSHPSTSESTIRELIGKSQLNGLLVKYYPYVIGHMFLRLDQEDSMEKAFADSQSYEASLSAFRSMTGTQSPKAPLPMSQPPTFRPRTVLAAIEKLGRRINKDMTAIWTSSVILVTIRVILGELNDTLGPYHALRIVIRLKTVISLCGKLGTEGYILQRFLQVLRPFLQDTLCANDAFNVIKYLLRSGQGYLEQQPGFLLGYSVAALLSLRVSNGFQPATYELPTTSDMVDKQACSDRQWLSQYLDSCKPRLGSSGLSSFKTLADLAGKVSGPGNAKTGKAESELLLSLLADNQSKPKLIDTFTYQSCMKLLLRDFEAPRSYKDDIFGSGEKSKWYVDAIWEVCRLHGLNQTFRAWAARGLGRAYNFQGIVPLSSLKDSSIDLFQKSSSDLRKAQPTSIVIFNRLVQLLLSENPRIVGLSEQAIGQILTSKTEEVFAADLSPPQSILTALTGRIAGMRSEANTDTFSRTLQDCISDSRTDKCWIRNFALALAQRGGESTFLSAMLPLLQADDAIAEEYFPLVVHLCLLTRWKSGDDTRKEISEAFRHCFTQLDSVLDEHIRLLVKTVLYLRSQVFPDESTDADRNLWLDIDFTSSAHAAAKCGMLKSSLLLAELGQTTYVSSFHAFASSYDQQAPSDDLLLSIFTRIEEPDAFYGVQKPSDLNSLAERFEYEQAGVESLLLRGMQADAHLRFNQFRSNAFDDGVIGALANLNLNGMTYQFLSAHNFLKANAKSDKNMYKSAIRLGRWDLAAASGAQDRGVFGSIYNVFKNVNAVGCDFSGENPVEVGLLDILDRTISTKLSGQDTVEAFAGLAALTEMGDVLHGDTQSDRINILEGMKSHAHWMGLSDVNDVSPILIARETLFSLRNESQSQKLPFSGDENPAINFEAEVMLLSSRIYREQRALEEALGRVTYLSDLSVRRQEDGQNIRDAVVFEMANVLEQKGQVLPAIRMLSTLLRTSSFENQAVHLGKAQVLATLGRQTANARLEKSEDVLQNYLVPALSELPTNSTGEEISNVHQKYAAYCHGQLESPEFASEFNRSEKFRDRKEAELRELDKIISSSKDTQQVQQAKSDRSKTKMWLQIDHNEYERLQRDKQTFLEKSLEHYLVSLSASDNFNVDILRFLSIWLANHHNEAANLVVSKTIARVPCRKFVPVMNQLASRLQDTDDKFQSCLWALVKNICFNHPYHGIHHVFAGSKTAGGNDKNAISRNSAASRIANELYQSSTIRDVFRSIFKSNDLYVDLARMRAPDKEEKKRPLKMQSYRQTQKMEKYVPALKVPPITMPIEVREDCDYSQVSVVTGFKPELTIASGLSAPKIVTAIASNGISYKQLYKAGNDDLRQDAIMEQVFEEATGILSRTRATRQRDLRIRTYKVIPLTGTSGVIEFVPNSVVLNDWLMPAHSRYFPKDITWSACRQKTSDATKMPQSARIKVFQELCARFHPVLRYFFFEHFKDPSDWFAKRLAYTRSTAAISMLGHALGLGDRHCQNILLDSQTGEVIHIDLGVAFEAGRILAVPEVVPFRLTRDIIDGFGLMKTEGVFRRCCEFTLDALRENKDVIITLLNVLRYDPLYNWSVSPLRAKRLREEQEREMAGAPDNSTSSSMALRSRRSLNALDQDNKVDDEDEKRKRQRKAGELEETGGEADRALAVVEKKLSKALSVQATVNELIQQASDERNLALLFCGWAAFA